MTTAASDVDSRLRCAVCHELYRGRKPKILPCYHTFCVTCLERLVRTPHVENKGVNFKSGTNVSKQAIICPTCRKVIPVPAGGVTCFLSNSYLDDEFGPDTNEPLPPCDFCEEGHMAKDTCKECKSKFCAPCRETHDMICPEREVIPLCSKPLATLQTINNGCLGIESVREQIEVLEAVLSRLDEEEVEVEHQKQAIESDIKARYDAGISTLTEAHDVCWNSLTAAVQRTRDRLQGERTAVLSAHERLTRIEGDPKTDSRITLLDKAELLCFKQRASKIRQPLFFSYSSGRASTPHVLNFFRDYMGHVSTLEGLSRVSETELSNDDSSSTTSQDLLFSSTSKSSEVAQASDTDDRDSEFKVYMSNLAARVELLVNKIQQGQSGPLLADNVYGAVPHMAALHSMGYSRVPPTAVPADSQLLGNTLNQESVQIGILPVLPSPQWRVSQPVVVPGFEPLTVSMLAAAPPQEQKQMLGERIYRAIHGTYPDLAGKITGMLLEMDNMDLLQLLNSQDALDAKVGEAVTVLKQHYVMEQTASP